jgi:protein-disulfide isomerase
MPQFQNDIKDPAIRALINQDVKEGVQIGLRGVPAVYINGKQTRARSVEDFQAAINGILNKSGSQ